MVTYPGAVLAEFVDAAVKGLNFGYQGSNSVELIRQTTILRGSLDKLKIKPFVSLPLQLPAVV